jgi:biopolymer transport protein ExbD
VPFQAPKRDRESYEENDDETGGLFAEINITPLTDVILVLLIIFMVASSAMVDAAREGMIDVTLPSASTASKDPVQADALVIGITADDRIYVHGQVVDDAQLLQVLESTRRKAPGTMIVVQADGELQHRKVVEVIDKLRKAGFSNVGIAAETDQ